MGFTLDEKASALVLRQVEFYFSDSNLPGDKFLLKCVEESADGLVNLPLLCSFGRMRKHLNLKDSGPDNAPTDMIAAVAEVLRKSAVLRVSDDGQKVGRVAPLMKREEVQAAVDARSIVVGPLCWTVTMEEVETFFSQYAKVNSVRLPRQPGGKAFCGYALIELFSEDEAKKALEFKILYDGIEELEIKSKKEFDADMKKQHEEGANGQSCDSRRNARYPRGLIVSFSLQKGDPVEPNDPGDAENKDSTPAEEEASKEAIAAGACEKGPGKESNEITREDIKNAFGGFGNVKYIDYIRGATSGYLRFEKPEEVQKARTAAVLAEAGGIAVKDHIATLEAVEGDAEEEYWAKVRESQEKVRGSSRKNRRGSRGGRHGGKAGQQNRSEGVVNLGKHQRFEDSDSGDEADEHPSKHTKTGEEDATNFATKQSGTAELMT